MRQVKGKLGFIGSGNMAEAMIGAVLKSKLVSPENILASDISPDRLTFMEKNYGIQTTATNSNVLDGTDIIVLSIKPQKRTEVLETLLTEIRFPLSSRKLIVSIIAGTPIAKLESLLYGPLNQEDRRNMPIVRVMPNTPALVLSAMSGMSGNAHCTADDLEKTRTILGAMGKVLEVEESQMDAVTALSGSGPAYIFYFIEAMVQGGMELGLSNAVAAELALQTAIGAMRLLSERGETPEDLRRKVTSPGGTTEAAVTVFQSRSVKQHIVEGILAAARRSVMLSQS